MKQDRQILEELQAALNALELNFEIIDVEGKDVLTCFPAEKTDLTPEDISVNLEHFDGGSTAMQIMISVFYDLNEQAVPLIERLLTSLNSLLSVGNFCLMQQEGYLYLNSAFLIDGIDEGEAGFSLAAHMGILTATAARARELLLPVVRGEIGAEAIEYDDYRISQML